MISESNMALLLPIIIALPLFAALFTVLFSGRKVQMYFSVAISALQLWAVVSLVTWLFAGEGADTGYLLGGWGAPLGIELSVDGLSAVMILLTCVVTAILTLYCCSYFSAQSHHRRFWPLWWLLNLGINGLFLSADIFNIYVTLEIIGLASVSLVALSGSKASLSAALRYLMVGLVGSLCYLLAVALLYYGYGTLDLTELAAQVEPSPLTWAALSILTVGLILKTALVPLHFWLPLAHGSALAPVSAVLSALVVKTSFYLLARFWLEVLSPAVTANGAVLLGVMGAVAIIWGLIRAVGAKRLKVMVAYSTVAQLGYLFLLFPLLLGGYGNGIDAAMKQTAVNAVAYFIVAHAFAKAAMFIAAGNIMRTLGHDDISRMQGMARYMPLSLLTFAIAGVSLIGLPPSAGFIAKWLLLNAAIQSGQWWWVVVMLAGGLMAAAAVFRVLNLAFIHVDKDDDKPVATEQCARLPLLMPLCGLTLAGIAIVLGFNAQPLLQLLTLGV